MLFVKMLVGKTEPSLKIMSEMRGIYKTDSKSNDYYQKTTFSTEIITKEKSSNEKKADSPQLAAICPLSCYLTPSPQQDGDTKDLKNTWIRKKRQYNE